MKGSGRVEYVFVNINEEIEIKLQSQVFSNVETHTETCSRADGYSDLKVFKSNSRKAEYSDTSDIT